MFVPLFANAFSVFIHSVGVFPLDIGYNTQALMADEKTTPFPRAASAVPLPGVLPTGDLTAVFLAMAHASPEEAAGCLRAVTTGDITGEDELAEEEVVPLWLMGYEGQLCGG